MSRRPPALALVSLSLLAGVPAHAQTTVTGSAEVNVARSQSDLADRQDSNGSIGQNYSVGWGSTLFDPRLFRYDIQSSYRINDLSASSAGQRTQDGRAGDLGYKVGATLLPSSPMPFFFQTSRTRSTSAGDLAPTNPIRSGLIEASGAPPADYESLSRETSLGWSLGLERLPQVTLGYRQGQSVISGGNYEASQSNRDISGSVVKNARSTHQTFHYQSTQSENVMEQAFEQRLGLIDYDFGAALSAHTRLTVNTGRRANFSKSVFVRPVDADSGAYAPSSTTGASAAQYGQVNLNYEPASRFSVRTTGNVDRQTGDSASTGAALASLSTQAEVVRGLVISASGTAGRRQQVVAGEPLSVVTRAADAGVAYQVSARWIGAGASATRGLGTNVTPDGQAGAVESRSEEAHLSTSVGWFGAGAGYERSRYRDEILDFGNYAAERVRGSVQAHTTRASLTADTEQLNIARGRAATFVRNLQRTLSSTASLRVVGQNFLSATGGHFFNAFDGAAGPGTDRSLFWSVGVDGAISQSLRLSGWVRAENARASLTQFNQDALSSFGRLEYRLRTLNFALEYRRSHSRMQYPGMIGPDAFAGRQIRFSVIRQFGMRVR